MDRSLVGRLGIGGLVRPNARNRRPTSASRPRPNRAPTPRRAGPLDQALAGLAGALSAPPRLAAACCSFVWARRRLRIAAIVLAIAAPLLGGGWLWLRGSSLVAVRHVRVTGARGPQARAIDAALGSAARRMTTLEVHAGTLRAAVAAYPVVTDVKVATSFPHGISIRVIERPAVATLMVGGAKTAVAADGVVLGPALTSASLPTVLGAAPLAPGQRLRDGALLTQLAALGAAPPALAKLVTRAYSSPKGLTFVMHSGLLVYFGDATRPHAKWLSLASVLADADSAGASYVDVRLPERPAAGFPGGAAPASSSSSEAAPEASSTTTAAPAGESSEALAEGLSAAVPNAAPSGQTSGSGSSAGEAGAGSEAEAEAESKH